MHRSFVKLLAQVSSIQLDTAAAEVFGPWVVNNLGIMDLILRETDLPGEAEGSHRDSRRKPFNGYSSCKVWRSRFLRDSKSKLSKLSKLKWTSGPMALDSSQGFDCLRSEKEIRGYSACARCGA